MVFLIQRSQNKDGHAVHLKLSEVVAALQGASDRLINVEDLMETEIRLLHAHYQRLVTMAKRDASLTVSDSVEEADERHRTKTRHAEPVMSANPTGTRPRQRAHHPGDDGRGGRDVGPIGQRSNGSLESP
jgi:hypothetical protein